MDILPSSEFRKRFASLTKSTVVTVNGHTIGEWTPVGAGAPIAMHVSEFEGGYGAERQQSREDAFLSTRDQTGLPVRDPIRDPLHEFRPVPKPSQKGK